MAGDLGMYEHFSGPERLTLILEALARGDEAEADRLSGSCPRKLYEMRDAAFGDRMDVSFDIMSIACIDLRCLWGKLETLRWATTVARQMATHHQISATFALMDGERLGRGEPQLDFFKPAASANTVDDDDDVADIDADDDDEASDTPRDPPRFSEYHDGQLATRMMGVEDRMQRMTDFTFAALLKAAHDIAQQLAEVWTAFDGFCRSRLGVPARTMLAAWDFPTGNEVMAMLALYTDVKPDPAKVDEYRGIYQRAWDRRFGEDE